MAIRHLPRSSEYGTCETVRANMAHTRQSERIWHIQDSQSEDDTYKTVNARCWPWISGESPGTLQLSPSCSAAVSLVLLGGWGNHSSKSEPVCFHPPRFLNSGFWFLVSGVWCMVYGVGPVHATRYTLPPPRIPGFRIQDSGVWCMVCGVWCMVNGV